MLLKEFKKNWKSGLSVALISVPLSLSLGIASGSSPIAGIITAIWAGLLAGIVGGSQFNIVGPAGALSGVLAAYSLQYGAGILPFLTIGAGLVSLIIWALNWDKYLIFVPSSVVHGFTLGVAFTIGLGQLNSALGLSGLPTHETLLANIYESLMHVSQVQLSSFIPFLLGLGILFFILKKKPLWPNSIIVAFLGIILGYASKAGWIPVAITTLGEKFPSLSLSLFSIPSLNEMLAHPAFAGMQSYAVILLILKLSTVIAFVLVLETLLSGKIADGITKTKFRQRREVFGVSLANLGAGLFGGIPASGVFARTAMNIKSGATSQWSQVLNAVFVAIITFVLLPGFNYIPMSIIAAILVYVAIRMITTEHFKKLYAYDKPAFWTGLVVAVLCVSYDAVTGILVGTAAALLFLVKKISVAQCNVTSGLTKPLTETSDDMVVYRFAGELTYVNSKSHSETLQKITCKNGIVLNFRNLFYIDLDGVEAMHEIMDNLEERKCSVYLTGLNDHVETFIKEESWYKKLLAANRIFKTTEEALKNAETEHGHAHSHVH